MAVRDAILALLLAGPAYGFQVHGELALRSGARREVNVGQTYATIDRLTARKLIEPAGTTDHGLPLHRLTAEGRRAAREWLDGADASGADAWDETVDRVLMAATLPDVDVRPVIAAERERWRDREAEASARGASVLDPAGALGAAVERAAALAQVERAASALAWLDRVEADPPPAFEPSSERPRRGRRPGRSAPSESDADGAGAPDGAASDHASSA
ncbi:PadR family transcriptional regulator [Agromyces sp. LHK192]|uniref:PadR family transcriptional regulator n=1 Tax=Agromyces sp. LHK192 TaxID=2498704 RepID=UPI000FDA8A10|nr:PadR family transcriptional regulator [Agromyces sp. LHK192]